MFFITIFCHAYFEIRFVLILHDLLKYITDIVSLSLSLSQTCLSRNINCSISATSSSTITDTGSGTGSSLLEMQITREELGATFTCKVNNIALMEPLAVDIKPNVHGKYIYFTQNERSRIFLHAAKNVWKCAI